MRVLMLSRQDVQQVTGGDTVQMMQTKAGLEQLGVDVRIESAGESLSLADFDLIHIFNWEQLEPLLASARFKGGSPPVVLSTIFWFHTGHWFEQAIQTKAIWKSLSRVIGKASARKIYEDRQQEKFRRGGQAQTLRRLLPLVAQLLPNSRSEIEYLEAILGIPGQLAGRSTVVPNGINRLQYDPRPQPNQAFLDAYGLQPGFVLEVARIQAAKNQAGLIEALQDVRVPIVLIGQPSPYEPDYVAYCQELARRRGEVYLIGPIPAPILAGIYPLAGVHVLPSWRETPGLASLEAAAAGCPIVTTSIGSATDYFGSLASYCDPHVPASITQAVQRALNTSPSEDLRQHVLTHYTWEHAAQATLDGYCRALGRSNRTY